MKERRIEVIKNGQDSLEVSFRGSFIERLKMLFSMVFRGKIIFEDFSWFGKDVED